MPENRFSIVCINEYIWKDREQHPQDIGCHALAHTFVVELSEEERVLVSASLEKAEYEPGGLREFGRKELVAEGVHPMLVHLYDKIFPPPYTSACP